MEFNGTETRQIALQVLREVNQDGKYANISLKENLRSEKFKNHVLSDRDAAFVTQMVYGTLEKQLTIDYFLEKFSSFKRVNPLVINILRLGVYQILYLDRVPDSAACNEAVNLCKKHSLFTLQGFVNGILRNIARSKDSLVLPDNSLSAAENLSLIYGYPKWLVDKWIHDYGIEMAEDILKPAMTESAVSIRINTMKTAPEELKGKLTLQGLEVMDGYHLEESLRIVNPGDIEENKLYQQGYFTVQGESSMLVAHVVDPQPGETILDACSSPGGKAIHMAELMNGEGKILAWDVHEHRVNLIKRNAKRMDADIVNPILSDAAVMNPELEGMFDRVLIDAPCSGLGVIYKKPDIKLRAKPDGINKLLELQIAILRTCNKYVKSGGVLVYSTCTINPRENEKMVAKFLAEQPEFILEDITPLLPDTLKDRVSNNMVQLIPSRDNTDGFFIARLRKKG